MPGSLTWHELRSPVHLTSGLFSRTVPEWVGLCLHSSSVSSCPASSLRALGMSLGELACTHISHSWFQNLQVPGVRAFTIEFLSLKHLSIRQEWMGDVAAGCLCLKNKNKQKSSAPPPPPPPPHSPAQHFLSIWTPHYRWLLRSVTRRTIFRICCPVGTILELIFLALFLFGEGVSSLPFKMSKSSRSAKSFFTSAASKLPSSKKDDLSSKQKKTCLGEKTERTGSEGNLEKQVQAVATPAPRKAAAHKGKAARSGWPPACLETFCLLTLTGNWHR